MKSQIYGILGLMYALALGILIIVALVGTSKQFTWQSSAPMYKFSMIMLSSNMQKVKAFLSQERAYSVDKAAFYTGAFGGYSTFSDLVPKMNPKICGCPQGSTLKNSGGNYYCEDSNGNPVQPNSCFISDGKKLNVKMIAPKLFVYIPEKYFVYWYNGTDIVPPDKKIINTTEQYMTYLFPVPDPRIVVPLKLLGAKLDFQYVAKITNFSNEYIDVEWIPIGTDSIVLNFPQNHPFLNYMVKIAFKTKVKNNIISLYDKAKEFVEQKGFNSVFDNASVGVLPTVIDENYVTGYTKDKVGFYYCNYSTSDRPDGNPKCSIDEVDVNNLKPMVALVYYVDKYYWNNTPTSQYYTNNMGSSCGSCSKPEYLTLDENDLENALPCTAEINSTINHGLIIFRINKFYGCNDVLKCMMCAITSNLNEKVGGKINNNEYTNAMSDENYTIKMVPLQMFNLTLNNVDDTAMSWTKTYFSRWINVSHYAMSSSTGCGNIVNGGQVAADSICLKHGFQKAEECASSGHSNSVKKWEYNISRYREISSIPSGYFKIDQIACKNGNGFAYVDIKDSDGKFSVLGKITFRGGDYHVSPNEMDFVRKDNNNVWKLNYICEAENSNSSDYVKSVYLSNSNGASIGNINITNSSKNTGTGHYLENITCSDGNNYSTGFYWDAWGKKGYHEITDKSTFSGGKDWANLFCQIKLNHINAYATHYYIDDTNQNRSTPVLNMDMSSSLHKFSIDEIVCNSGELYALTGASFKKVINAYDLHINTIWIPFDAIDLYQPQNFVGQKIALDRICYEHGYGAPVWVKRNDSAGSPYLIYDAGKSNTNIAGYVLNEIKCDIK